MRPGRRRALLLGAGLAAAAVLAFAWAWRPARTLGPVSDPAQRKAAKLVRRALRTGDPERLREAASRLGSAPAPYRGGPDGQYLRDLVSYLLTPEESRAQAFPDPLRRASLRELTSDHSRLALVVLDMFFFGAHQRREVDSEEAYAFELSACTNPQREMERPQAIVDFLALKPGDRVADVGSGPGYYTFRFAEAVGGAGRVYAVEVNRWMIDFLKRYIAERRIGNVVVWVGKLDETAMPEGALDQAFMTHMFVDIERYYGEAHKRKLYGSVLRSLKPGGCFTVCEPTLGSQPDLTADEIAGRLRAYGFRSFSRPPAASPLNQAPVVKCVKAFR